jgi:hypothetical protein
MLWAIYQSRFAEWVPVTISSPTFQKSYISPTWKRRIDLATQSIRFARCLSIMTIWRRHCHILHLKAGTLLTLQMFSTYCPWPINGEVHAEPICHVSNQFKWSPSFALYYSRYIIWAKPMSTECAEVSNQLHSEMQRMISEFAPLDSYSALKLKTTGDPKFVD